MFSRIIASLLIGCLFSISQLLAIDASVSFVRFLSPDQTYLEIHTHIAGGTVDWDIVGEDSLKQAMIDFIVILKQNDTVVIADRFTLNSPVVEHVSDFVDLRRYAVKKGGTYQLELILTDLNDSSNVERFKSDVLIEEWPKAAQLSDITFLASVEASDDVQSPFYRHGVKMEPLPHAFYNKSFNTLSIYNEVYSTDSLVGERILLLTKIEKQSSAGFKPVTVVNKIEPQGILKPHLQQINISNLPSGRYLLAVELRDEQNELVARKELPFYRSNPSVDQEQEDVLVEGSDMETTFLGKMDFDSLKYSVLALMPLLPQSDILTVNALVKQKNAEGLRMYLYAFWMKESPYDAENGYIKYMAVADFVNRAFNSGFRYGFESDRGYIYIKYGRPNDITRVETDPTAPPYEVWSYNSIPRTGQQNRRFIFYNPSLAAGGFELLHSDVFGEKNNPEWEKILYRNGQSVDEFGDGSRGMGRNARNIISDY